MNETQSVIVVVPNVYNGKYHDALPYAEKGERIEVARGAYAASLVESGFVRYTDVAEDEPDDAAGQVVADLPVNDAGLGVEDDTPPAPVDKQIVPEATAIRVGGRKPIRTKPVATKPAPKARSK